MLASFVFARNVGRLPLIEARTIATTVLVLVGLYLILVLEATTRRRAAAVGTLTGAMLVLYALVVAAPGTRHFFALTIPGPGRRLPRARRRRARGHRALAHRRPVRAGGAPRLARYAFVFVRLPHTAIWHHTADRLRERS